MDKEMEQIAWDAFFRASTEGCADGVVFAACEAVLAEQKRRTQAQNTQPQMDTTMADEVRQQPAATMYSLEQVERAIRDELEKNHKWLDMHKPAFIDAVRARLTAKQQLATMYSLDAVEKAVLHIADNRTGCPDWPQFVAAVRARLTAKQQPTEQEIVTTVLEKWADWDDADKTNELSASEVAAKILATLGKGGK